MHFKLHTVSFLCLFTECIEDGVVIFNPFRHRNNAEGLRTFPDDDLLNAGIDDLPFAHGAGIRILKELIRFGIAPDKINRCTDHIFSGGGDDCIRLRMNTSAKLISFTGRYFQCLSCAASKVRAVFAPSRSTVITGGNDFIIPDDDGTVFSPQAGGALKHCICYVEIVVFFAGSAIQSDHSVYIWNIHILLAEKQLVNSFKREMYSFLRILVVL